MRMTLLTLTLLGLMLLAEGVHCLRQDADTGEMRAGGLYKDAGDESLVVKFLDFLNVCVCRDFVNNGSTKEQCQCVAEMDECYTEHRLSSTATADEIFEIFNGWMPCVDDERTVAYPRCREMMFAQPLQLMCEAQELDYE